MKITKEETTSREVVLNIELEEEDLEPYLAQAARRLGQRVRIPGFRQGKAPRAMVVNMLGPEIIREEAIDLLVGPTVQKALEEQEIDPFALPQVEIESQEPIVLKAVTPTKPSVDLGNYKEIKVEPEVSTVEDEKIDEVIERYRYDSAPWEPVERPAELGDLLTIDVDGWIDEQRISEEKNIDYVLREENVRPFAGFADQLVGTSTDEEKEFTLTVPEEYPDPSMVGKECQFKVKVLDIKAKNLPDLDDEFAKSVGEGQETMEALRDKVQEDLQAALDREEERRVEEEVLGQVVEQAVIEYSPLLLDREVDRQMERREEALKQNRMDMESYLAQVGKSEDEVREELRDAVRRDFERSLVMEQLVEEESVEVTPEQIDQEIEDMAARSRNEGDAMRNMFSTPDGRRTIENMLITRQVMERLRLSALGSVPETEPEPSEESADSGEEEEKATEAEGGITDGNET